MPGQARSRSGQRRGGSQQRKAQSRPTHFLALRLSQFDSVTNTITQVQDAIRAHTPSLAEAFEPAEKAHITLQVMDLADPQRLALALRLMSSLPAVLNSSDKLQPLALSLKGLSSFHDKVLFLDIADGRSEVVTLQHHLVQHFQPLHFIETRAFTPHVTIAKMSKVLMRHGAGDAGVAVGQAMSKQQQHGEAASLDEPPNGHTSQVAPCHVPQHWAASGESRTVITDDHGNTIIELDRRASAAQRSHACVKQGSCCTTSSQGSVVGASGISMTTVHTRSHEGHLQEGLHHRKQQQQQQQQCQSGIRPTRLDSISHEAYRHLQEVDAGEVVVLRLELCSMTGRQPGQFYPVLAKVALLTAPDGSLIPVTLSEEAEQLLAADDDAQDRDVVEADGV